MTNVARLSKNAFTWSVVAMTVLWSMGAAALVPLVAQAVECPALKAGDLFKVSNNSAVYLLNSDLKAMYFPNGEVYSTWYAGSNATINVIPNTCVDNYPSDKGINFRPGARLVKRTISPNVFAVGPNNTKHKIANETVAKELYGANWAKLVRDLPDVFDANLALGAELTAKPHNGQLVKKASSADVYMVVDGKLSKVDGTLGAAASSDVRTVSDATFASLEVASGSVSAASVVANPAQKGTGSSTTPTTGAASASLAATSPAAGNVPDGAAFVDMVKVNVTATSGDVDVKGLTITRTGFTSNSNVTGVSVWDANGMRHGEVMTSFNSNNQVVIGFGSNPVKVAAGTSQTITVKFNLGTSASGGTVGATVSAIDANATVSGLPVAGNVQGIVDGNGNLSAVTVDAQTVGGASSGSGTANVEIGETKEIAKVKFTETSGINDVALEQVTFYFSGTIKDTDLKDLTLVAHDNTVLGTVAKITDRYATIKLNTAYTIPKSSNRTVTLKGTVVDGSGNYFIVQVQNEFDVVVKDKAQNVGIVPSDNDGGPWSAESDSASGYFIVKSGAVSISKSTNSPSGSISAGASDVLLGKFDVKAVGEGVEVRKMGIKITTSSANLDLTGNVRIVVDGQNVLTFSGDYDAEVYGSGEQKTLSSYFTIPSGQTKVVEVYGNIDSAATTEGYTVSLGNFYVRRLSTLDFLDNTPSASVNTAANSLSTQSLSVAFVKDTSMGNKTVAASADHVIGQYIVKAGAAEAATVNTVTVNFWGTGAMNVPTMLQNLSLWVGDEQIGSTVSTVASSSNSFAVSLKLAKNEAKTIKLKASLLSDASGAFTASSSVSYAGDATGNTGSSSNIDGQTITIGSANVVLSAASDSSTVSKILTPSASAVQVGKWKYEAQNEEVTLKKITFSVADGTFAADTSAGNWGTFYLYDSADMNTALGTAAYIPGSGNGYVQFTGLNWTVAPSSVKYLVLKAAVNGSGTMDPASTNAFVVTADSSTYMEIFSSTGAALSTSQIDATAGVDQADSQFATSTWALYHNSVPVIAKASVGTALQLNTSASLLKFTVTNSGDREMRIGTTTISVSASGLTSNATFATGTISSFRLYEANAQGGLGSLLATASNACPLSGGANPTAGCAASSATSTAFGPANDTNSAFDNLTVAAGQSRTFILVADTSDATDGKASGTITVTAQLDGTTGFNSSNATTEIDWEEGVMEYYYTPLNSNSENGPYTASDSYDVVGDTLSLTL